MAAPLPAKQDLTLYRGDTRVWTDTFTVDGDPMDLTGHTFLAQIRANPDDDEPMAVMDVDVLDADAGVIQRTLTAEEAAKLVPGRAHWDLQVRRTSDGHVRTYIGGAVKITADVSRA